MVGEVDFGAGAAGAGLEVEVEIELESRVDEVMGMGVELVAKFVEIAGLGGA